jgi:hypothetical protein
MMFSPNAFRSVLVLAAAYNAVTSATVAVDLGDAEDYVILAKTGISTGPTSAITGDIGVSPIGATAMTGFSFSKNSSEHFSTSSQITSTDGKGKAYASDYKPPIPTRLTTAVHNMETAYNDTEGRDNAVGDRLNLGAGTLGGNFGGPTNKLTPGVYTFTTGVNIANDIYFHGNVTDVFIIQMTGTLTVAANKNVSLSGGAQAENIFWQVAGEVVVNAGAHMEGNLLVKTAATFKTGSSLFGRVLSQTACNLQVATMTGP